MSLLRRASGRGQAFRRVATEARLSLPFGSAPSHRLAAQEHVGFDPPPTSKMHIFCRVGERFDRETRSRQRGKRGVNANATRWVLVGLCCAT